ncbi:MAG: CGNR zinc finger domain-containing protein [Micromonosporaceae bacterium]
MESPAGPAPPLDRGYDQAVRGWAADDGVPAELALAYDLANTLDERVHGDYEPFDLFSDPTGLTRWLTRRKLLDRRGTTATPADLALALRLREQVRDIAYAHGSARLTPDRLDRFAELASRLPLVAGLDPIGRLSLQPAVAGVPGALARVLADALTAAGSGSWVRLKMCAAPDCQWVFYDQCRPRTGRWCSMNSCGNRMKTRAYRARVRQGA